MYASGRNRLLVVSRFISIQIRTKMAKTNDVVEIESDPESKCTRVFFISNFDQASVLKVA